MAARDALLAALLEKEDGSRRLADVLADLRGDVPDALVEYLEAKEAEDRARVAHADRERWHRRISWRLVQAVMLFGVAAMALFVAWGGERAFQASILFVAGGGSFYVLAQTVLQWRARADRRALDDVVARSRARYRALEDGG